MEDFSQKIEEYLLGELRGSELSAFENALQKDAALAKSVELHREMMLRLEALRIRKKVGAAISPKRATPPPIYARRSFWAAMLVLLALGFWFFYRAATPGPPPGPPPPALPPQSATPPAPVLPPEKPSTKPDQQFIALAQKFHVPPQSVLVRDVSANNSEKSEMERAATAYQNGDYRSARNFLGKIGPHDEEGLLLRANAFFKLGQFATAARDFEALTRSFQFKHEARWNFLLCQIALGKTKEAKILLAKMLAEENFPFRQKALELNRKLSF